MRVKEIKFYRAWKGPKQGLKNPAAAKDGAYDAFSLDGVTGRYFQN